MNAPRPVVTPPFVVVPPPMVTPCTSSDPATPSGHPTSVAAPPPVVTPLTSSSCVWSHHLFYLVAHPSSLLLYFMQLQHLYLSHYFVCTYITSSLHHLIDYIVILPIMSLHAVTACACIRTTPRAAVPLLHYYMASQFAGLVGLSIYILSSCSFTMSISYCCMHTNSVTQRVPYVHAWSWLCHSIWHDLHISCGDTTPCGYIA